VHERGGGVIAIFFDQLGREVARVVGNSFRCTGKGGGHIATTPLHGVPIGLLPSTVRV